jgi:hypothetical protein
MSIITSAQMKLTLPILMIKTVLILIWLSVQPIDYDGFHASIHPTRTIYHQTTF